MLHQFWLLSLKKNILVISFTVFFCICKNSLVLGVVNGKFNSLNKGKGKEGGGGTGVTRRTLKVIFVDDTPNFPLPLPPAKKMYLLYISQTYDRKSAYFGIQTQ